MKTTIDIQDELLARAKRHAQRTGRPLRAVVEDGLRRVLSTAAPRQRYCLPDYSVGEAGVSDPLEA
ncbi:MAG: type II toxin-antitoxin system VapB family antitoxin [Chloroflexi bacterium]|nr:type II toxin-antitoxin system VapB family antitoxin [Chloroflexota bacterium]MCY3944656.1 type II toxin-antitoxin system VapB family antitoxin [Anaerolineaceae bacterium]MCY4114616.1 type II toxin-antitoxin system VapB family antitoxin [Chloroflexota bacterium]